ncbi:MAG: nucleotidyltransferase family protein [Deltaproteobacteria bacterium]|nr:nucleotidyltransferase family protein [Deltaproteobacteria bacterium]
MKNIDHIKQILESQKQYLKEHYHVSEIGVFGSYVRGEQTPESDVDILVSFDEVPSLLKFVGIENYLSDLLWVKVDLVMKRVLKPFIGEYILREVIYL